MSTNSKPVTDLKPLSDRLEAAIDRPVVGSIALSPQRGMMIESMGQAMEFAKLMALSGTMVPKHLRNNPGACLAISIQAYEWQINPFSLAAKSYDVKDRICYEASVYQSIVSRRAQIAGRIKTAFEGEAATRRCRVWADLADGTGVVEYTSPIFGKITPKNSPLWESDPDQQLFYFSVRAFARRHFPDVMMGVYTVDEMQDSVDIGQPDTKPIASVTLDSLTCPKLVAPEEDTTRAVVDVSGSEVSQEGE